MDFSQQKLEKIFDFCYDMLGDIMFENMENLKIEAALFGNSSSRREYHDRPFHGLVYKFCGDSWHTHAADDLHFTAGTMIFLPKGVTYSVRCDAPEESRYALINFSADLPPCLPKLFCTEEHPELAALFEQFVKLWLFRTPANRCTCLSLFYEILAIALRSEEKNDLEGRKKQLLAPAMDFLKDHIFDPNLRTEQLHRLCGVSDTYFRSLFLSRFGMAPKQYILHRRLNQARSILESGEYAHIYEVAAAVGFTDSLYFSRAYKKQFGTFPSAWEKR